MNKVAFFITAFVLWMLLTWSADIQNVTVGAAVTLALAAFAGHLFIMPDRRLLQPVRMLWFLYFLPVFVLHMVRANLDVAYRVLHLNVPIRPGIVKVHTTLTSDIARTLLANAITLTPGTLTLDIDEDWLYIHWINVTTDDPAEQTALIVSRFESILKRVFE